MDRRVYILPLISVLLVIVLLLNPDITGFMVAEPSEKQVFADIVVSISEDGFVPEDSIITVYLGDRESSMGFKEFIEKTGEGFNRIRSGIPQIGYEGYGYEGPYTYSLDINEFGIDTVLAPGEYELVIEVSRENYVISKTSQLIEV
jgi:hypothetical protein